jgi:hypothetical protein
VNEEAALDAPREGGYKWSMTEETIAKIEAAIRGARAADHKDKAELIRLLEQLKTELKREKRSGDAITAVEEKLTETAAGFEASHPQVTNAVNEIATLLASIGI